LLKNSPLFRDEIRLFSKACCTAVRLRIFRRCFNTVIPESSRAEAIVTEGGRAEAIVPEGGRAEAIVPEGGRAEAVAWKKRLGISMIRGRRPQFQGHLNP
jgi:hypothetical protein